LGKSEKELAKKVKKLVLVMEGTPDGFGVGEGVTSQKGSKVKVKGFINLKKKDEL
jgi:ribosome biogenesis protein Nip4